MWVLMSDAWSHSAFDHAVVGVADRGDVVVAVEVAVAVGVEHPHALAAHEVHGLVVEELVARGERLGAAPEQGRGRSQHLPDAVGGGGGVDVEPAGQVGEQPRTFAGDVLGDVRGVDDLVLDEQAC